MDITYHYPPDLLQLLVAAIPRLCKTKRDVLRFFRGAGTKRLMLADIEAQLASNPDSINKFAIAGSILERLNEAGEKAIRERRELLKRVVQFEDYSTCWEDDRLEAQGLVSQIQRVVNVRDSFTRMNQEREAEARKHREAKSIEAAELRQKSETLAEIRKDFNSLFTMHDAQKRGLLLEKVLNRLFSANGILVSESFSRVSEPGQGTIEQIDGVIKLEGHLYFVEMKWLKEPVGVGDVSQHLVRVFNHSASRGIFISYSEYTAPAIAMCKESLSKAVVVLCTLQEFVHLLEKEASIEDFLKAKINGSMIDKQPFTKVLL